MRNSFYVKLKLAFFAIFATLLSACATVDGMGQDIESAGEEIQDAADSE
ncbi:entericidin A/B family lipoprotein [Glaciecola sp. 1036]